MTGRRRSLVPSKRKAQDVGRENVSPTSTSLGSPIWEPNSPTSLSPFDASRPSSSKTGMDTSSQQSSHVQSTSAGDSLGLRQQHRELNIALGVPGTIDADGFKWPAGFERPQISQRHEPRLNSRGQELVEEVLKAMQCLLPCGNTSSCGQHHTQPLAAPFHSTSTYHVDETAHATDSGTAECSEPVGYPFWEPTQCADAHASESSPDLGSPIWEPSPPTSSASTASSIEEQLDESLFDNVVDPFRAVNVDDLDASDDMPYFPEEDEVEEPDLQWVDEIEADFNASGRLNNRVAGSEPWLEPDPKHARELFLHKLDAAFEVLQADAKRCDPNKAKCGWGNRFWHVVTKTPVTYLHDLAAKLCCPGVMSLAARDDFTFDAAVELLPDWDLGHAKCLGRRVVYGIFARKPGVLAKYVGTTFCAYSRCKTHQRYIDYALEHDENHEKAQHVHRVLGDGTWDEITFKVLAVVPADVYHGYAYVLESMMMVMLRTLSTDPMHSRSVRVPLIVELNQSQVLDDSQQPLSWGLPFGSPTLPHSSLGLNCRLSIDEHIPGKDKRPKICVKCHCVKSYRWIFANGDRPFETYQCFNCYASQRQFGRERTVAHEAARMRYIIHRACNPNPGYCQRPNKPCTIPPSTAWAYNRELNPRWRGWIMWSIKARLWLCQRCKNSYERNGTFVDETARDRAEIIKQLHSDGDGMCALCDSPIQKRKFATRQLLANVADSPTESVKDMHFLVCSSCNNKVKKGTLTFIAKPADGNYEFCGKKVGLHSWEFSEKLQLWHCGVSNLRPNGKDVRCHPNFRNGTW